MTPSEVADLLSLSSELDRYSTADKMTRERVIAWAAVFASEAPAMTFSEAQPLVIRFYGSAGESLTAFALIELWKAGRRLLPHQIAADVRSAKARGLLAASWVGSDPLPTDVAERLSQARLDDQGKAPELSAMTDRRTLQIDVGRKVPRA